MLDATQLMGWGGVGWDVNGPCTCTHVGCYAIDLGCLTILALAHMLDATQYGNVPCTCTHVGCYAIDGVGKGWKKAAGLQCIDRK